MRAFARQILAEWLIVRARLLRTRLGLWLAGLAGWVAWLGAAGDPAMLPILTVRFGMLAAVLAVAYAAGSITDRVALDISLTHPTSAAAIATGRWIGATAAASLVAAVGVSAAVFGGHPVAPAAVGLAAGVAATAATAAAVLPAVWVGGNALAGALFLYIAVFGALSPRGLAPLLPAGVARTSAAVLLEALPSVWRYSLLANADVVACVHAATWVVGGLALAALWLGRRR